MSSSNHFVEDSLALELIDTNLYRSTKPLWHPPGARGIFGGAVIAQALSAALKTVDPVLQVHSLHSYFVLAYVRLYNNPNGFSGDSSIPVVYSVEIVRNGRSFATRTVRSLQRGAVIFVLTASFQRREPSPVEHGKPSAVNFVPPPEALHAPTPDEYAQTIYQKIVKASESPKKKVSPFVARARENGEEFVRSLSEEFAHRPIDFRYVSKKDVKTGARPDQPTEYRQYVWFKANGAISTDPRTHAIALAYASDHNLLSTSIRAHNDKWDISDISVMVSLDHIIYFHDVYLRGMSLMIQEIKVNEWLLYESVSPWAGQSRGLNIGYIFSRDGKHVATCVQEGLLRLSNKARKGKL